MALTPRISRSCCDHKPFRVIKNFHVRVFVGNRRVDARNGQIDSALHNRAVRRSRIANLQIKDNARIPPGRLIQRGRSKGLWQYECSFNPKFACRRIGVRFDVRTPYFNSSSTVMLCLRIAFA